MTPEEIKEARMRKKRLARFRFRSLVRKVIANQAWLSEIDEGGFGDNVRKNVAIIVRRKGVKGILTLEEKAMLNTPVQYRTDEQRKAIVLIIAALKCFDNYQPKIRSRLARVTYYQYFAQNRVVIREGHYANAIYFILDGEITVTKLVYNHLEEKWNDEVLASLGPGDVFGEVSLLQGNKRIATCRTALDTELLCVYRNDFQTILKEPLSLQWDQIKMSLQRFDYFSPWTFEQIQDCCILSKIKQYNPLQTIYAEDQGRLSFVFFVLSGECFILQCLRYKKTKQHGKDHYELKTLKSVQRSGSASIMEKVNRAAQSKRNPVSVDLENKHKQVEAEELKSVGSEKSVKSEHSKHRQIFAEQMQAEDENQTVEFVEVGSYSCGSVFGLGEEMIDRTIVAKNFVQCLLIPRFWLFKKTQNVGNVWQRTKMYLNSSLPSRQKIFDDFVKTHKWNEYKRSVINEVYQRSHAINTTTLQDVPMICRIDYGL